MPLELRPGLTVLIPCRHCLRSFIPYAVRDGQLKIECPRCHLATEVVAYRQRERWQIRTAPVKVTNLPIQA